MSIIGLDFGNCYSFPCYIPDEDMDETRLGGHPRDLLPHGKQYGYPSVFFYSKARYDAHKNSGDAPPWCGFSAVTGRASPEKNRIKCLKRHLGEPLRLDDWDKKYDDAIVLLIQYIVRQANKVMYEDHLETTNQVSIAYPATFTRAKIELLKTLAQRATLEDGRHIQIVGMIAEPAAAALDYMVEKKLGTRESTVLTYDLGGGTFDLAVVSAYPQGRRRENGEIYYYDIENIGGLEIGGTDFDNVMKRLIKSKLSANQKVGEDSIARLAETAKLELTEDTVTYVSLISLNGEEIDITVSRQEFEKAAKSLVNLTIEETKRLLRTNMGRKPEMLVLTGGASQMPMIRASLEAAFPEFRNKIYMYNPSRAISHGTARFITNPSYVEKRLPHDIGISFYNIEMKHDRFSVFLKAGTPLPCQSKEIDSYVRFDGSTSSTFSVYEAKSDTYQEQELERDFNYIYSVRMSYPAAKENTRHLSKIYVDETGLLTIKSWDPANPNVKVEGKVELKVK